MKRGPKHKLPSQRRFSKIFSFYREDMNRLAVIQGVLCHTMNDGNRLTESEVLRDMIKREYARCLQLAKRGAPDDLDHRDIPTKAKTST